MSIATASDFEIAPARPLLMPLVTAAACVALADWLFSGWQPGISLALFLGGLGVVAISINRACAPRNIQIVMSAVFVAGLLAVAEDFNDLSQTVAELATAVNSWLVTANAATLALYGCCFINTPWLVASYNVEHCREVGGTGPNLDLQYLASLGPQALPPIEAHMTQFLGVFPYSLLYRMNQDLDYFAHSGNWRAWSFRARRLQRYFANKSWLNPSDSGGG
jgi:Domain of unknown function (DUF4173)